MMKNFTVQGFSLFSGLGIYVLAAFARTSSIWALQYVCLLYGFAILGYFFKKKWFLLPAFGFSLWTLIFVPNSFPVIVPIDALSVGIGSYLGSYANKTKSNLLISQIILLVLASFLFYIGPLFCFWAKNKIPYTPELSSDWQLKTVSGEIITAKNLEGKIVFWDFWHSYCSVCLLNFPNVASVAKHYQANDEVVFLAVDLGEADNYERFQSFVKKHPTQKNILFLHDDKSELANFVGAIGVPLYLISHNNQLYWMYHGVSKDEMKVFSAQVIEKIDVFLGRLK